MTYAIPPVQSAGLMLTYHCTNACRHCIYYCSPQQPDEWISVDMAKRIFSRLREEKNFSGLHFAGGEATMNLDLLEELIQLAREMGIPIDYLETNAAWCGDEETTDAVMTRLRDAGLPCILVSACMYHNEFVPVSNMKRCVKAGRRILGDGGVFVYPSHLFDMLDRMPGEGTHSLHQFCEYFGIGIDSDELHDLFPLIPSGRAVHALRDFYKLSPAASFADERCADRLQSPHHAHFDLYGNLFTGACAGICPATVNNPHVEISAEKTPVFHTLCREGPCGLMKYTDDFEPDPEGYAGKCDFCYQLRKHLHQTGHFKELRPDSFYTCR